MQILQTKLAADALAVEVATPADAQALAQLYQDVYRGEYPCPELFTPAGMAEFLDFQRSHVFTVKISFDGEVLGCVSCELNGRVAYLRGGMIAPSWQGHVSAGALFKRIFTMFHAMFGETGKVDYFYAETRTSNAKFHTILFDLGYAAYAILPRKDVFEGKRECEVIHGRYFRPVQSKTLRLTPRAAQVASKVLGHPVRAVSALVPSLGCNGGQYDRRYTPEPNGDGHLRLQLASGAYLEALFCPASREVENVAVKAESIEAYGTLLSGLLVETQTSGMEYVEVYAPADSPARQVVLEELGFSPMGFLPQWYGPGMTKPADCVLYAINFTSDLLDCDPKIIRGEEFLCDLVPAPVEPSPVPIREIMNLGGVA